jgi:tetratricopeptide (TPR) repeat protein
MNPDFALAHRLLAIAYERKGMYEDALRENQIWGNLSKDHLRTEAALGHIYAVSGRRTEALNIIQRLENAIAARKDLTFTVALIYTGLGETDKAFEWLNKAYDCRSAALGSLRVDPKLDSLRSDPRFEVLLKKMGFSDRVI